MNKQDFDNFAGDVFTLYPTRIRKKEKIAFLEFCRTKFKELGYSDEEISSQKSFLGGENLVVGAPDAPILFTAHYDTPGNNGNLSVPFSSVLGHALASLLSLLIIFSLVVLTYILPSDIGTIINLLLVVLIILMLATRNKNNRNDNTSGVLGVINLAAKIAKDPSLRSKCAFVLFDNEEKMMLGSSAYATWVKQQYPNKEESLVINLDCIGVGETLLVASKNDHQDWQKALTFFESAGYKVEKKLNSFLFLSDNAPFSKGIFLAFMEPSKLGYLYYPNIHTSKDTQCNLDNIEKLCSSIVEFVKD